MLPRQPYHGLHRKLVVAFDVGTTYSGVSYSVLDPGEVPRIQGVNRFPAQEAVGGDAKIPTILYYNPNGQVEAIGAEALQESIVERAEDEEWVKVEWFKLHLRPQERTEEDEWTAVESEQEKIPPLPFNKTPVVVLADFMRYLYQCTRNYIQETHANGTDLWNSVEGHIDFILSHPNGWEGVQQSQIRRAAILAGLVPDTQSGHSRIQFVTEGEASLHFCVGNGLSSDVINSGEGVIIVDAGGGTVDLSAYSMVQASKSFEEIAPPECLFQGSVYVTRRGNAFLKEKLRGSRFGNQEDIRTMTECFDKTTKLRFRNADEPSYVKFGTARDRDPNYNIRSGQLKLLGTDVATLFEPSVHGIIAAIERQRQACHKPISAVFLVGGFAASDWLFTKLLAHLEPLGLSFCRPDSHVNKAVADGAVSFYVDHFVSVRVARFTYGNECLVTYDPSNSEHRTRSHNAIRRPSGLVALPDAFDVILSKGTRVSESTEFRKPYYKEHRSLSFVSTLHSSIHCYRGAFHDPKWTDVEPRMFSELCTIEADTSQMAQSLEARRSPKGAVYYRQSFEIILLFGLTELQAQLCWIEDGEEKRGPATVVYDEPAEAISM